MTKPPSWMIAIIAALVAILGSTEAPFVVDVPDAFTQAFVMEKDSKRFPTSGGWGYALFNYEAASDKFTADPSPSDCGHACHVAVKAKDHIFHPYQKR